MVATKLTTLIPVYLFISLFISLMENILHTDISFLCQNLVLCTDQVPLVPLS